MKTQTAIQSSANVIRITSVKAGDVYKRFADSDYDDKVYYGVVKSVHNDGEKAIIEAVEYCYKYSDISVEYKIINGTKDVTIFPSSPDELNLELEKARKAQVKKIEAAQEQIETSNRLIEEIDGLVSGKTLQNLQAMSYKELTQADYETKKLAI